MYASQTKRLCVREASTDETRAQQHPASSSDAAAALTQQEQTPTTSSLLSKPIPSVTHAAPTTRTSSRASQLVGGGPGAAKEGYDKASPGSTMTASATGNAAGSPNESPVKHSAVTVVASLIHNHVEQPHQLPPASLDVTSSPALNDEAQSEEQLIKKLADETREEAQIELILSIRNLITACNKKKISLINNSNFVRIIRMIDSDEQTSSKVKAQLALLLCSVAKGDEQNVKILNNSFVDDKLINLIINSQDDFLIEACLRCVRAIMSWPKVSRSWLLYDDYCGLTTPKKRLNAPERLIHYALQTKSFVVQECIADIFASTCCRERDQDLLHLFGGVNCLAQLLESPSDRVIKSALNWCATLCLRQLAVSCDINTGKCPSGQLVRDRLIALMGKNEILEIQFLAAKCYAMAYKITVPHASHPNDSRITTHVLPTLVRMVHKDKPPHLRSGAAECIASLIDNDAELQSTASTCDHLIDSLANMLEYESVVQYDIRDCTSQLLNYRYSRDINWNTPVLTQRACPPQKLDSKVSEPSKSLDLTSDISKNGSVQEMRRTAFLALAALASKLEVVRKRIFDTCSVMQHLVRGLTEANPETLKSVLTCLLSLSRSVQQLRTSFAENSVYNALKNLLSTSSNEILILVLSILCNISLDFSPGRQHFLDTDTIKTLCSITKGSDPYLRLHGMWILMNMVYELKDRNLKFHILGTLGPTHILSILETGTDKMLVLKTLGFLRNLLSPRTHIDEIMKNHGKPIMRAIQKCLERSRSSKVRELALCVLTNIADGTESKSFIMDNRIILGHLAETICNEVAGDMRLAAICCITNLAHKSQEGFHVRQNELKHYGIQDKLKLLLNTDDLLLSGVARTAYNQFLLTMNEKYEKGLI